MTETTTDQALWQNGTPRGSATSPDAPRAAEIAAIRLALAQRLTSAHVRRLGRSPRRAAHLSCLAGLTRGAGLHCALC